MRGSESVADQCFIKNFMRSGIKGLVISCPSLQEFARGIAVLVTLSLVFDVILQSRKN